MGSIDWLTGSWSLLGFGGQNWMLIAGGGLLLYIVVLAGLNCRALLRSNGRYSRHHKAF